MLAPAYTKSMNKYSTSGYGVRSTLGRALRAENGDECAKLLAGVSDQFDVFREAMPHALRGEWPAVTVLVSQWHSLVRSIVESAAEELPELVKRIDEGFGVMTTSHEVSGEP